MEETGNITLDEKGKKNIIIVTNGQEKIRISVLLAIAGDGIKLPPLVVFKGVTGGTIEKNLMR